MNVVQTLERLEEGPRAPVVLAAGWLLVLAAVLAQAVLLAAVEGRGAPDVGWLVEWRMLPVALWAAASPLVIRSAARFPVRRDALWTRLTLHGAGAAAWILLSNVLMRLPATGRSGAWGELPGDAVAGALEFGPGALLLYGALVAVGHLRAGASGRSTPAAAAETGRLALRQGHRIHLVEPAEVRWVEADGDHVKVHTSARTYRVRGTMKHYEGRLAGAGFLRIHRSALVHPSAIRELQPYFHGDHVAILRDGTELRVPRTREEALARLLGREGKAPTG